MRAANGIALRLLLPSGKSVARRFDADTPVRTLCDFVETLRPTHDGVPSGQFAIATRFPRARLDDSSATLRASGVRDRETLLVLDDAPS